MNRIRVFTSGALFVFAIYCLLWNPQLPFIQSPIVYFLATCYFAFFPIKDMLSCGTNTLYKGRQFQKNYQPNEACDSSLFQKEIKIYDQRALHAMLFWLIFLAIPGFLYVFGYIGRIWIFFFFALSNFSVFFAIFGWCPFHAIFIRPDCCMECRIYNWDSFFQYSFLIFFPHVYTYILVFLGILSLVCWEYHHALHPERFYKSSNANLTCEHCDLDGCRHHKKKMFHTSIKEEYQKDMESQKKTLYVKNEKW